ncbi:hypothetical protein [Aeoliella mucimassa]|uniref:hypothetical protein n=1 Tax=Aeoliella mucimassa TaxID=2527972 RepID=UPI00119D0E5A|nr:hypothetical protein [Aeoliella mucimassa]
MQKRGPTYKCEATTLEGFIQQLAVGYVARRYFFYVSGRVPKRLTPQEHDARLLDKYGVAISKWSRYRRTKRTGPGGRPLANVQYIRYRDFWVLLSTAGYHRFFQEHVQLAPGGLATIRQYQDVRQTPVVFGGYTIGHNGKASVRLSRRAYRELKEQFLQVACLHRTTDRLEQEFRRSPFESYGGVTRQMFALLKAVNKARKTAGLSPVPRSCVRVKRKAVKPFEPVSIRLAA